MIIIPVIIIIIGIVLSTYSEFNQTPKPTPHNPYLSCPDCNVTNTKPPQQTSTHNSYLSCPDCNDTSNIQEMPTVCTSLDNGVLPDPKCTSGAIDPSVTQDNIDSTICVSGYTKTVRPPVSVTEPQKFESMKAYGFDDSPSNYEFDHLIPLEIGGAPDDLRNLWPESHDTTPNSYDKDGFENYLNDQVCSGKMDLKTAQNEIATNWVKYWEDAGSP